MKGFPIRVNLALNLTLAPVPEIVAVTALTLTIHDHFQPAKEAF